MVKMMRCLILVSLVAALLSGCHDIKTVTSATPQGDSFTLSITPGPNWIHRMPVMPLIVLHNRPQIAAWLEDEQGHFLGTVYITQKTASGHWTKAPWQNPPQRPSALPVWSHRHTPESLPTTVTSATPKAGLDRHIPLSSNRAVLYVEVNHSTDFNAAYPKNAAPGTSGYSGGKMGSGQPSLVYRGEIDQHSGSGSCVLELIGHGSPDGREGNIDPDLSGITTAREIVQSITIRW